MNNKRKKGSVLPEDNLDCCKAASPTDCTGLIQVPPETEAEYKSYNDVYRFAPDLPVNLDANNSNK